MPGRMNLLEVYATAAAPTIDFEEGRHPHVPIPLTVDVTGAGKTICAIKIRHPNATKQQRVIFRVLGKLLAGIDPVSRVASQSIKPGVILNLQTLPMWNGQINASPV